MSSSKTLLLTILGITLLIGAVAAGIYTSQMNPNQANGETKDVLMILDGTPWSNGTLIDWGTVYPDATYTKNMTVTNNGSVNVTVSLLTANVPTDWILDWTGNNTLLQPSESIIGDYTATTPVGMTNGTYTWDTYLNVET